MSLATLREQLIELNGFTEDFTAPLEDREYKIDVNIKSKLSLVDKLVFFPKLLNEYIVDNKDKECNLGNLSIALMINCQESVDLLYPLVTLSTSDKETLFILLASSDNFEALEIAFKNQRRSPEGFKKSILDINMISNDYEMPLYFFFSFINNYQSSICSVKVHNSMKRFNWFVSHGADVGLIKNIKKDINCMFTDIGILSNIIDLGYDVKYIKSNSVLRKLYLHEKNKVKEMQKLKSMMLGEIIHNKIVKFLV